MIVVVALGMFICSKGLQNGVERITKVMMIGLLGLIVVLAIHGVLLDGGMAGVKFYLYPDFQKISEKISKMHFEFLRFLRFLPFS